MPIARRESESARYLYFHNEWVTSQGHRHIYAAAEKVEYLRKAQDENASRPISS